MSDYRPWEKPAADEPAQEAPAAPVEPPKDDRFSAAPGLATHEATNQRRGPRFSAAMILGVAGFLLIGGIAVAATMSFAIGIEQLDPDEYVEPEFATFRGVGIGMVLVGLLVAAAGFGLLYEQPWGHPAGIAASVLALLPPFTLFGVLSLAHIGRDR